MHLAVPRHDVRVIILLFLQKSDQCFYSIGWIHRPNYLEYVHNNIVPIYFHVRISTSNNNIKF